MNYKYKPAQLIYITYNFIITRDEIAEFANSVNLDEVAHNEPSHLDLHCLPSSI